MEKYDELLNLPENSGVNKLVRPEAQSLEGDNRMRMSPQGEIEMFCTIFNLDPEHSKISDLPRTK